MTDRNRTSLALSLLAGIVSTFALLAVANASDGPPSLASESGIAAWWQSGALAAPLTAVVCLLLWILERLSATRWPGLGWLRRGNTRAYLSMSVSAVAVLLPNTLDGSITMGGLCVALLGGLVAARPGGGERKAEEVPS